MNQHHDIIIIDVVRVKVKDNDHHCHHDHHHHRHHQPLQSCPTSWSLSAACLSTDRPHTIVPPQTHGRVVGACHDDHHDDDGDADHDDGDSGDDHQLLHQSMRFFSL